MPADDAYADGVVAEPFLCEFGILLNPVLPAALIYVDGLCKVLRKAIAGACRLAENVLQLVSNGVELLGQLRLFLRFEIVPRFGGELRYA